ncbi:MAG: hypothetical protein ACOY3P_20040 [Planctomycetota bacterium]
MMPPITPNERAALERIENGYTQMGDARRVSAGTLLNRLVGRIGEAELLVAFFRRHHPCDETDEHCTEINKLLGRCAEIADGDLREVVEILKRRERREIARGEYDSARAKELRERQIREG